MINSIITTLFPTPAPPKSTPLPPFFVVCNKISWIMCYVFGWSLELLVAVFHYYWKTQSDIWGCYEKTKSTTIYITGGDFSASANTINSWLTTFLWSQASQVIQGYSTPAAGYSLIFLASHFVWALSLMFLYSGRGYWQEFIESVVWSHTPNCT